MKIYDYMLLHTIKTFGNTNQRILSKLTGYSIGLINQSIKKLRNYDYICSDMQITKRGKELFAINKPQRAIILAAGYGMRMVPINIETPKGLLEIKGEPIIEHTIKQLHEVGVREIYIVVGFMKEAFEYLIDEYNVKLIFNSEYSTKNNLHSLALLKDKLSNCYIIPSDIYCYTNPFDEDELFSWYMVSNLIDDDSYIRINRKNEIVKLKDKGPGNSMIGIAYLTGEDCLKVSERLMTMNNDHFYDEKFWEETLFDNGKMFITAKAMNSNQVCEINTYEQLRDIDKHSNQLKDDAIDTICKSINIKNENIINIRVLKKGMTNRSFLFTANNADYIMRIPGEGTDKLINRKEEATIYNVIKNKNICDDIVYINPDNGYKITKYFSSTHNCNPKNFDEVSLCMDFLRQFHDLKLKVDHEFNLFDKIEFYESLWGEHDSIFKDYKKTKSKIYELKEYIDKHKKEYSLTHIDAVCDNFLFVSENDIRLIDWEYAAMQDTDVDIAMFAIYALYDKNEIDKLIKLYYKEGVDKITNVKIYCYIAICGLLWSNWCEYKRLLGVEFGEYALKQYRYAKEFYKYAKEEMEK